MNVVVIGGSGTLGKELQKLDSSLICPTREQVDIRNIRKIEEFVKIYTPDVIINAAAIIDNRAIEKDCIEAIETNIIGAANMAIVCFRYNIRLVYISSDYVYSDGSHGNYKESDPLLPFNLYTWTKLGGEASVNGVKNHLIIRTSFGKNEFDYPVAFVDKWSSKDYVDKIAPLILEASLSPLTGVLNLGTERKTLFYHAKERNENVSPIKLSETSFFTPYDTSLNLQKWIDYKSQKSIAKSHTHCRMCNSTYLTKYLDLGLMPLSNNLENTSKLAKNKERFPLQVMFCEECGLSQLSVVIDPSKMFSYYTYRSGVNGGYIKHCKQMCDELQSKYSLNKNSFIVDIAGNDGSLLKQFKDKLGLKVLNIDSASNLVAIAESQGIESIADFWSIELAKKVANSHRKADIITATNVFAHVNDVKSFIEASKYLLKYNGVLVLEFPYLVDFIENNEFDTVYFEHLSYVSVLPLNKLCHSLDMKIIDVEKQNIHGGTIRVSITHSLSELKIKESVNEFLLEEEKQGYNYVTKYYKWQSSIRELITNFSTNILELKKKGNKISSFAASAKGNTLLNSANITTDIIDYICDETPEKIGKFSPGTGIPIVHPQELLKNPPDYLIILAWNFKEEIIAKVRKLGYKGKFIIPIPSFQIID